MNNLLKSLIASAFMVSLAAPVAAEGLSDKGVLLGFSMSNVGGDDAETTGTSNVSRKGFAVGGFGVWDINNDIGIRTEAWYIQKGYAVDTAGTETPYDLSYVEVPIMAQYKMPMANLKVNLFGGPYLGFLLSADSDGTDFKDNLKSMDYGIQLGAGVVIQQQYTVDLRYSMGLTSFDDTANPSDVTNTGFLLSGGYMF